MQKNNMNLSAFEACQITTKTNIHYVLLIEQLCSLKKYVYKHLYTYLNVTFTPPKTIYILFLRSAQINLKIILVFVCVSRVDKALIFINYYNTQRIKILCKILQKICILFIIWLCNMDLKSRLYIIMYSESREKKCLCV